MQYEGFLILYQIYPSLVIDPPGNPFLTNTNAVHRWKSFHDTTHNEHCVDLRLLTMHNTVTESTG